MQDIENIKWLMHPKLKWEYFTSTFERIGELFWPSF